MLNVQVRRTSRRIWSARIVAMAADAIQIAIFPAVVEGAFSPVDDVFDLLVAGVLTLLVGWHIAFIPSFIVKLMPVADLAPTWTAAIFIATWGSKPGNDEQPGKVQQLNAPQG